MEQPQEVEKVEFRHAPKVGDRFMFKAMEMAGYGKPFAIPQTFRVRGVATVVEIRDWLEPVVVLELKGIGKLGLTAEAFNLSCKPI